LLWVNFILLQQSERAGFNFIKSNAANATEGICAETDVCLNWIRKIAFTV